MIMRKFDHPNIMKLQGLIICTLCCNLYLVFKYIEHDIARLLYLALKYMKHDIVELLDNPDIKFFQPHIKCYMKQ